MFKFIANKAEEQNERDVALAYNLVYMLAGCCNTSEEFQNYLNGIDSLKTVCKTLPDHTIKTNTTIDEQKRFDITLQSGKLLVSKSEPITSKNTIL